ncbi:MAG: fructose-6-phosphate aldolase [Candidatus Omnitrophica bacterium]|nr:fructose-6-phosphate aldolase [Candidatus Omnitrophota bacterium]
MKLFLDSANLKEIEEAVSWGAIDGVTTNPSLVAKENQDFVSLIRTICERVNGPVSMETTARDAAGMIEEGRIFATVHPHVVVKCPLTKEGLTATRQLTAEGIRVNVTLCFSPSQALLAAKAGAYCVSPFVGRLDDISQDGMGLIRDIKEIFGHYRFSTQILVASVRHPLHVVEAARIGADIATMSLSVLEALVKHPLTDAGLERFLRDWDTLPPNAKRLPTASDVARSRSTAGKSGDRPTTSVSTDPYLQRRSLDRV